MKLKSLVTTVLLFFVAVSVGFMIGKEGLKSTDDKILSTKVTTRKSGTSTVIKEAPSQKVRGTKVVVYYFHGNTRCFTCRAIENFSRAAVGNGFPDELQKGRLEFQAVNVEEPANEHFVRDYQLVTRSVVLVRYADGKQEKWKNLDRVWELVRDNEAFAGYVQTETRQFLGGA